MSRVIVSNDLLSHHAAKQQSQDLSPIMDYSEAGRRSPDHVIWLWKVSPRFYEGNESYIQLPLSDA